MNESIGVMILVITCYYMNGKFCDQLQAHNLQYSVSQISQLLATILAEENITDISYKLFLLQSLKTGNSEFDTFLTIYFIRVIKQWVLSINSKNHKSKSELDLILKDNFTLLGSHRSLVSTSLLYFLSPHRYKPSQDICFTLTKLMSSEVLRLDDQMKNRSILDRSSTDTDLFHFFDLEYISINSLYSYRYQCQLIRNCKSQPKGSVLLTDGTIPSVSFASSYEYIWIVNGLHLSELVLDLIKISIIAKLRGINASSVDIFIGMKDIMRAFNAPRMHSVAMPSILFQLALFVKEVGISVSFLNYPELCNLFSNLLPYDVWGYLYRTTIPSNESLFYGVESRQVNVARHSHSLEYKLMLV